MPVLALDIHDVGLRIARSGEPEAARLDGGREMSPGVACIDGDSIVTGARAAAQAALRPLATSSRFWDQLATEPFLPGNPDAPSRTDVAIAHLRQAVAQTVRGDDDVVIAVPPWYDTRQLGVLLSVARQADLRVVGLVARPIVPDLDIDLPERTLVVDLGMHRGAIAVVETHPNVTLERTELCPGVGVDAFRRRWINAVGAEFVRKTRFDPLHDATTEQHLHDQLPKIINSAEVQSGVAIELESGGQTHRITLTQASLTQASHSLIFELISAIQQTAAASDAKAIVLMPDANALPGLAGLLRQQVTLPIRSVEEDAVARSLARLWPDHFADVKHGVAYHVERCRTQPVSETG